MTERDVQADRALLKSIGVRYEIVAECFGITPWSIRMWAINGIPDNRRQDVLDMAEAYRQIKEEQKQKIQGERL